ncbi:alcohol dehydrogenase catalytic domain-containing protein [Pseudonocardia sp. ICBG1142]|uniref:alcohol dehydrogenase catalytic domain-containing protein n=1 Tax=Pseudonocardia sp. ICBG1142 TaxID=2846760 RepID=UPI002106297E|nr:alcohol dehydrogenase catalytic domain-containing protein [Pseudonocardia sp. ICBG1142]
MIAAVTTDARRLVVTEVPDPVPGPGEVLVRPLVVGVCGSDLHLFDGDAGALSGAERGLPRIQGHEIAAEVLDDPSGRLAPPGPGSRCGRCCPAGPAGCAPRARSTPARPCA